MNVTVERIPESQIRLQIAADQEEQEQAIEKAIRKISREIAVPGFRKGKAPRSMIERMYGREAFVEEANQGLIDDLFRKAIDQEEIVPVGDPVLDSIEPDPLSFVVRVPVYPVVEPGDYLSVRAEQADAAIEEAEVDELLAEMQRQESPWVDPAKARKPREGDQITVDIEIKEGDEEFRPLNQDTQFIIGESNLLEELREAIVQLKPGESGSADITFAEDDERYREDDPRRGKTMTYNVTLKGIKERELLPLDDEFASTYGKVDTLEALRNQLQTNLHVSKTREARSSVVSNIIEQLHELATFDVPAAMIDDAVNERLNNVRTRLSYSGIPIEAYLRQSGQTEEALKEDLRPQATTDLRTSLILREIADREGIEVSDGDIEAEIGELVAGAPEEEEIRQAYSANANLRAAMRNDLFDQRLTDRLIEIATEGKGAVTNAFVPESADDESAPQTEKTTEKKLSVVASETEEDESSDSSSTSSSDDEAEKGA